MGASGKLKSSFVDTLVPRNEAQIVALICLAGVCKSVSVSVSVCAFVCACACAATHRKLRVCTSVNFPLLPNSLGLSLSSVACRQPRSGRVPVQARIHFQL